MSNMRSTDGPEAGSDLAAFNQLFAALEAERPSERVTSWVPELEDESGPSAEVATDEDGPEWGA